MNGKPNKEKTALAAKEAAPPKKNLKSRKYQLTINNPLDAEIDNPDNPCEKVKCPFTHDEIKERIHLDATQLQMSSTPPEGISSWLHSFSETRRKSQKEITIQAQT